MHMKIKQDILVGTRDSVVVGYVTVNRKIVKKYLVKNSKNSLV